MTLRAEIDNDLAAIELELSVEDTPTRQTFELLVDATELTADTTLISADAVTVTGDATLTGSVVVTIPCAVGNLGRTIAIDPRGNALEIDLRLTVRRKAFLQSGAVPVVADGNVYLDTNDAQLPLTGRTVLFRGEEYRIMSVKESSTKSHFEIALADSASNQ